MPLTVWLNTAILRGDTSEYWRDNAKRWQANYDHSGHAYWLFMFEDAKIVADFLARVMGR